jgi:3-hydroxyisobutyrate dehydrogenase-like beta-hydroxyacid dehydrogenase
MIAQVLIQNGLKVVTCLEGRSERTQQLAEKAGALSLPTIQDVVAATDLIISVVPPEAALALASTVANAFEKADSFPLFADANAISPMTSVGIGETISAAGGRYVDVSIIGPASKVGKSSTFCISGQYASDFAQLEDFGLRVRVLGEKEGQASAFKVLYAGFTKGLCSLMVELLLTARSNGILDQIIEQYRSDYPETTAFVEWFLPSFPFRAARRAQEMEELKLTIEKAGIKPFIAPGSEGLLRSIGNLNLRTEYSDADEKEWKLKDVINILYPRIANTDNTQGMFHKNQ